MSLLDARMTHGEWQPTGQLRDDRIEGADGRKINELVHKACLARYHADWDPAKFSEGAGSSS
jgi:hypothetical protein